MTRADEVLRDDEPCCCGGTGREGGYCLRCLRRAALCSECGLSAADCQCSADDDRDRAFDNWRDLQLERGDG